MVALKIQGEKEALLSSNLCCIEEVGSGKFCRGIEQRQGHTVIVIRKGHPLGTPEEVGQGVEGKSEVVIHK